MFKKLRLSIFFKLIIVVIVTLVVMDFSVLYVLRFTSDSKPRRIFPHYVRRLERLLVNDIGYPPDTLKAKDVAADLDMNIRFQSHDFNWASAPDVPTLEQLATVEDFKDRFPNRDQFGVTYNDRPYSIVKDPRGIYILQLMIPREFYNPEVIILLLVYVVSFILIILYLVLRWLFRPLKSLSAAVQEIGKGNYDINVPVKRKDELGELAKSLNDMAAGIKLGLEVGSANDKVNEDVKEMENMITGLLENYRAESEHYKLNQEKSDIVGLTKEIISESGDLQRISLNANHSVIANVDRERFKLVLRNVVDNALKYSADRVTIDVTDRKDGAVISVKDKGVGIAEEDLKYIFEPFYRSDPSRSRKTGGFGLGLSICKKIMDAHNGKVEITSKVNEGTEVILTFPK